MACVEGSCGNGRADAVFPAVFAVAACDRPVSGSRLVEEIPSAVVLGADAGDQKTRPEVRILHSFDAVSRWRCRNRLEDAADAAVVLGGELQGGGEVQNAACVALADAGGRYRSTDGQGL